MAATSASTLHSKRSSTLFKRKNHEWKSKTLCKTIATPSVTRGWKFGKTLPFAKKERAVRTVSITLRSYLEAQRVAINFQQIQRAHFPYDRLVMKLLGSYRLLSTRCTKLQATPRVLSLPALSLDLMTNYPRLSRVSNFRDSHTCLGYLKPRLENARNLAHGANSARLH